jgi:uncharacterized caspase-like protein
MTAAQPLALRFLLGDKQGMSTHSQRPSERSARSQRQTCVTAAFFCLTLALLPAQVHARPQEAARHALIIGNQKYAASPLLNPDRDAKEIAAALKSMGFDVDLVLDATLPDLTDSVEQYLSKLREGDTSFVFFAGHGFRFKGENYLAPVDLDLTHEGGVEYASLPLERLLLGLENARLQLNVVALDAGRDNPLTASQSSMRGLTVTEPGPATLLVFAAAPGAVSSDSAVDSHGAFAKALLKELPTPGLDVVTLFQHVKEDVSGATNQTQLPWFYSSLVGSHFLGNARAGGKAGRDVSEASAVPPLPSLDELGLEASVPASEALARAKQADAAGIENASAAHDAWESLAKIEEGNPYRALARARARHWGAYDDAQSERSAARTADFERLKSVLKEDRARAKDQGRLVADYLLTYGVGELNHVLAAGGFEAFATACGRVPALAKLTGRLHVEANGKARVFIDGGIAGDAPVDVDVRICGTHRIGASYLENGEWREEPFLTESGDFLRHRIRFRTVFRIEPKTGLRFVRLRSGTFHFGHEEGDPMRSQFERDGQDESLDEFWLQETDVTVDAYAKCVAAGKCTPQGTDDGCNRAGKDRGNHPINCVDWNQAVAFCGWIGARLPSAREWEYAAKSASNYPWGNTEPTAERAAYRARGTFPVTSHTAGATKQGLLDMAGNVWQWTADSLDASAREVRGGGWDVSPGLLRTTVPGKEEGNMRADDVGFRCAL